MNILKLSSTDLNLLPVFQVLLEERSVTTASGRLGLTQPAVSRNLARLRELFNDPLFTRTPKGLNPTPRAVELSLQLQQSMQDLYNLVEPANFDPLNTTKTFRLATTDYGAHVLLPAVVERLYREAPNISLELLPWKEGAQKTLSEDNIDLATCTTDDMPSGVYSRSLGEDEFVCVMRQGHPCVETKLTLKSYIKASHALITMGGTHKSVIDRILEKSGLTRHITLRSPHFVAALALVAQNNLLLTIPYGLAKSFASHYNLSISPFPGERPRLSHSIIWHERNKQDPAHSWFRKLVHEEISKTLTELNGDMTNSALVP